MANAPSILNRAPYIRGVSPGIITWMKGGNAQAAPKQLSWREWLQVLCFTSALTDVPSKRFGWWDAMVGRRWGALN